MKRSYIARSSCSCALDPPPRFIQRAPFERLVQVARHPIELVLRMIAISLDDPVLHRAFRRDEYREHLVVAQTHEVHPLEHRCLQPRRHHQRGLSRSTATATWACRAGLRPGRARRSNSAARSARDPRIRSASPPLIDVVAKRFFSRDPPRRGMRLKQITAVLELRHHVADHRGAHAEMMPRDDLRGAHRLRGRDEFLHRRDNSACCRCESGLLSIPGSSRAGLQFVSRIQRYIQGSSNAGVQFAPKAG